MALFQQPKNTMPRIECIYAFLSVDAEDGNEGVVGAPIGPALMPLIAADEERLEQLTPIAQWVATETGMSIRLVKFTHREEIGFITPNPGGHSK